MRALASLLLLFVSSYVQGQGSTAAAGETRAARIFQTAQGSPPRLGALLARMPKGGDLHMHLSGAVYAETLIEDARADLLCVDSATKSLVANVGTTRSIPPQPVCGDGRRRAADAFADQRLYDELIDSFSMRAFVPSAGVSGHDHFFATFDRFDPTHTAGARHGGEWLQELTGRAAAQNEQYLEIMHTPDLGRAISLAQTISWPVSPHTVAAFGQDTTGSSDAELKVLRASLLANPLFEASLAADQAEFATILRSRKMLDHCGEPQQAPGCAVEVRFLFQVLRAMPPAITFAQTLLAFALVDRERENPRPDAGGAAVVGLNFVQPEDNRLAMAEYTRQMRFIGFLHTLYPKVPVSLHAGELAAGLVPPDGLRFHIRQAVEIAHAERIGHGVDIMAEDHPEALLAEMAEHGVMAEINLTSNDGILGVTGSRHPLPLYRGAGVPVALSTDDEGVNRSDLTREYLRAATDFQLGYRDLKRMVRTSLEHSFLPGESLWRQRDVFTRPVAVCGGGVVGSPTPSAACRAFLSASARAAQQWEMERRFHSFEDDLR